MSAKDYVGIRLTRPTLEKLREFRDEHGFRSLDYAIGRLLKEKEE